MITNLFSHKNEKINKEEILNTFLTELQLFCQLLDLLY